MKEKILFIKNFFLKRKEVWAILPSSFNLAKEMVKKEDIEKAKIIVEIWGGTWVFTKEIVKYNLIWKKVFVFEINKDFYKKLKEKFEDTSLIILNEDILDIDKIMEKYNINHIDLIISWIPFRSLPSELFDKFLIKISKYFDKQSYFLQFSYFKKTKKDFEKYFKNITYKKVWLNIPSAYVFKCNNYKK